MYMTWLFGETHRTMPSLFKILLLCPFTVMFSTHPNEIEIINPLKNKIECWSNYDNRSKIELTN